MSEHPPTLSNHCGKCGASLYPDAKYCHNCSAPVSSDTAPFDPTTRVTEFYPTYMVTLVSIIQAAALGYLLLAVLDQLKSVIAGTYDPLWTILIVAMFVIIVATWVQYTRSIIFVRLVPSTADAAIPFFFGVTQALTIFSITLQQVAWVYFAFGLTALVGFAATFTIRGEIRQHHEYIENRILSERAGSITRINMRWMASRAAIFFSFGVIEALFKLQSLLLAVVALALNATMIILAHRRAERALGK